MSEPIARREFIGQAANGERFPIILEIGRPYQSGTSPETWSCAVSLDPLYPHLVDQVGSDSFQALILASNLAIALLFGFKDDGGRLLFKDGSEYPLEALVFAHSRKTGDGDHA